MNSLASSYFQDQTKWQKELLAIRSLLLNCGLTETLKWGSPCYMFQNINLVLIGGFKHHFVISFFNGAVLQDVKGLLSKPGPNTQTVRWLKFTSLEQVEVIRNDIKAYIFEAIEAAKAGIKPKVEKQALVIPDVLKAEFKQDKLLKKAWDKLTPGRQRAYIMFFDATANNQTKIVRIQKYKPRILAGKGMNDCIALSKRMPGCDGSHKMMGSMSI